MRPKQQSEVLAYRDRNHRDAAEERELPRLCIAECFRRLGRDTPSKNTHPNCGRVITKKVVFPVQTAAMMAKRLTKVA